MRAALGPEHLDQQVRGAVRDRRLLAELGVGVDEHEQLHDPSHAVELADLGLQAREQVEDRECRRGLARRDVDLAAELALVDVLAVAVGPVAGDEDDVADRDRADVAADGGVRGGELVAELGEALFGGHRALLVVGWRVASSGACRGRRRARSRRCGRRGAPRPRRACSCSRRRGSGSTVTTSPTSGRPAQRGEVDVAVLLGERVDAARPGTRRSGRGRRRSPPRPDRSSASSSRQSRMPRSAVGRLTTVARIRSAQSSSGTEPFAMHERSP